MTDREKVIKGLGSCVEYFASKVKGVMFDEWLEESRKAIALLKAQEPATIKPKRIDLEEETKAWLDKMDAVDALGNIADICIDWDGYRTADGLGGLINEIWAYARYCADRLKKAQEPVEPKLDVDEWRCGNCGHKLEHQELLGDNVLFHEQYNYCPNCGRKVKGE